VASTATGAPAILEASTLTGSTATPLFVENLGNGDSFRVDDSSGDATPFLIDKDGDVLIGTNTFGTPKEKLKVEAGPTSSSAVISAQGTIDAPLYVEIKNRNSGSSAASLLSATADDGNFSTNYLATGIASSGFSDPAYSIAGPHDAFLFNVGDFTGTQGGNLIIGTAEPGMSVKFISGGGVDTANEQMRIDSAGNIGMGTTTPGSKLDVKGELRLSGATSGYVGLVPAAVAGSTTYTLPAADGSAGYVLSTSGAGVLSWSDVAGKFQRVGTVLSPVVAGDAITTSGNIYTTGTGTITSAGLLTGSAGAAISGATTDINANSNFDTNINTGTSTGAVTVGNGAAGAINVTSGAALGLTGGTATNINTTTGDITMQPAGTGTTANVQIGAGGVGSVTPDLLSLDVKSTTGDPGTGTDGAMYYNEFTNKFRCHINGSWGDCDTTGGTVDLQSAYNAGNAISTAGTNIALTLNGTDQLTASGAGSVNLTPTGASSFTSGGALTLTGGGASTWSTSSGALTLTSASAATWGTTAGDLTLQAAGAGTAANIKIGAGGAGSTTPDLFGVDVKSTTGDPLGGYNGAMYYNAFDAVFRCYEAGGWKNCGAAAASASTLQQAYTAGPTITTAGSTDLSLLLSSGNFSASGVGSVDLTPTGASSFTSGGALTLTGGAASTWGTSAGSLNLQAAGSGTTSSVQIGVGGAGSANPDLLALDVKSTAGDPAGFAGAIYYNANVNKFRCYENISWKDCDAGVVASFQTAYNNGGLVTTSGGNPIAYTLASGDFTATGVGSVNLTPTGASSFTSGGALTLTGGAASTWGTSAGNLNLQAAGAGTTASVQIGVGGVGSATPDLLAVDVKSTAGDPAGFNGAIYYNANTNKFRCYQNGGWVDCDMRSIGTAKGDLIAYTASNSPTRLPVGTNGQVLISDSTQATGLRWSAISIANNSLDFTQFSDAMTVDANTTINLGGKNLTINDLTGGGTLSMSTNAAPLTLTAGAASNWTTTAGALTIDAGTTTPAALNLGTTGANAITIGKAGLTTTSIGPVQTGNAANTGSLRIADGSTNYITLTSPPIASDYTLTLPTTAGSLGQALTTNGTGTLSWSSVFTDPMTTRGDIIYRDATNTTTRLGRGTAGQVLKSDGTDIAWSGLTSTDVGLGNVTNDAQIKQSIGTAKGDLVAFTATNSPTRMPVGSNGQVLISDSTQATGLRWSAITIANNSLDFTQFSDAMTVDANTSINMAGKNLTINDLTGGSALNMSTNGAALTLTGGAASNWTTTAGALTIDAGTTTPAALNLGTTGANAITIGKVGLTTTNVGPVQTGNAANAGSLRIADGSTNFITVSSPAIASDYTLTLPTTAGSLGQALTTNGTGTLSWSSVFTDPMTTRGDIIYRDSTNTTTRLGRGTAGQVLKSNGTDIAWNTLTGSDVGLGNVTNDAQIKQTIGTAKGDLIGFTASNTPVRVPAGALDGYVLTTDTASAAGIKWGPTSVPADSLDFAQFSDTMAVDANTSINLAGKNLTINDLTGGGVLNMSTNAAALTLTAGAASTWATSVGALTVDSAAGLNLGTTNATGISIGRTGGGAINLTTPSGVNLNPFGVAAGNTGEQRFLELAANGANYVAFKASDSLAGNTPYVLPTAYPGVSGYSLTSDTSGNLSWANIGGVLPGWTDNGTTVNLTTNTDNVLVGASGAATAKLEISSSDANALRINPYGAAAGNTGNLELMELAANGTNYVGFRAPDNIASNVAWALPSADGTNGQYLATNGTGSLSWSTAGIMPTGTTNNSTMRYNSGTSAWVENTNLLASSAGTVTIAAGQSYTGAGAVTLSSGAATALTVSSGTTGAINIGTDANAKAIQIGNSTTTTSLFLDAGTGGVKIGDSTATPITNHLSGTSSLNFGLLDGYCQVLTFTITGAVAGDMAVASPTPVAGGIETGTDTVWQSYVSNVNTVTVRACDTNPTGSGIDPSAQTWRVDVWRH
jgi:hypothetical protein